MSFHILNLGDTTMNIAIYSRKSKFTGKGESIENQIQLCTEYAYAHFDNVEIKVYEDEGFSGKNTDRPQFKQLMKDIKDKKVDVLMCYRLDRISRNVSDFSSTLEILEKFNVAFVSIKEQFDTSSPMGRAMTYISSVFAQLERETIAERIKDNMLQLSKTGRWLGGTTPTGYKSCEIILKDPTGKDKKMYALEVIPRESELVKLIFNKFIEFKSLTKLETYLIQNEIKTKNNKTYCIAAIKLILNNPVYVSNDLLIYDYLINKGYSVYSPKEDFIGLNGLMAYNRTKQSKKTNITTRDASEWVLAIGQHKPIIDSSLWIEAQEILSINKNKSIRRVKSTEALLSGLLRCKCCGSYMRPKRNRKSADGSYWHYYYICELKEKSLGEKCNVKNIAGHTLDKAIIDELKNLSYDNSNLKDKINRDKISINTSQEDAIKFIKSTETQIKTLENEISNLLSNLSSSDNTIANKYILNEINAKGAEIENLQNLIEHKKQEHQSQDIKNINLELIQYTLSNTALIDHMGIEDKRNYIKTIIEDVLWDGNKIKVNLFGEQSLGEH